MIGGTTGARMEVEVGIGKRVSVSKPTVELSDGGLVVVPSTEDGINPVVLFAVGADGIDIPGENPLLGMAPTAGDDSVWVIDPVKPVFGALIEVAAAVLNAILDVQVDPVSEKRPKTV